MTVARTDQVFQRLVRSESALRGAQSVAQLGRWMLDYASGELIWSDEAFRMLGLEPGSVEPTFELFLDFVHPDDRAAVRRELEAAPLRADGYYSIEHRVLARGSGGIRFVRARGRVNFDDQGCPATISGTALDITERVQVEAETLQQERLERGLLELSALFLRRSGQDMDGLIHQALARMGELTGTDRAYLFSADSERRRFTNTHEWTAPGVEPVIHLLVDVSWDAAPDALRLLASGCPVVFPSVAELSPDYPERAFLESQGIRSLLLVPVMQGDVLTGFVGFDAVHSERDWSSAEVHFLQVFASLMVSAIERERFYADMMAAKQREMIGHLASGVAHDFNNLLGVIDANLYYLSETLTRTETEPEIEQVLEETLSALGQAKVVTSGILSLSRAGGFAAEPVEVGPAIGELVRILRQILPPEVRLHLALEPALVARSNAAFLQAALLNLLLNARDAMPGGGDLRLSAASTRGTCSAAVSIGVVPRGDLVQLCVVDTGCGMHAETMGHLFEPLFSTKAQQRGHGLGLFMVHEFVLRSGARLEVDSRPGEGSEFRLLLPAWGDSTEPADPCRQVAGAAVPPSLHVMVVDDDSRFRDSVRRLLEMDGVLVETAENGLVCLERLRSGARFDLILSDVSMPVVDGVELLRRVLVDYPDLPVILMTGQAPSVFPLGDLPGNPVLLRKPFHPSELREAIAAFGAPRRPVLSPQS